MAESAVPPSPDPDNLGFTRKKFLQGLIFLPYGRNLLTQSAVYWILPMVIVTSLMAITESFAWYEMASTFSGGRIFIALIFAIAMSSMVWMFDATIIMTDLSKLERSHESEKEAKLPQQKFWRRLLSNKLLPGIIFRGVAITISLIITMPYLGDRVQRAELIKKIDDHNLTQIAQLTQAQHKIIDHDYKTRTELAEQELGTLTDNQKEELKGQQYLNTKKNKTKAILPGPGPVSATFDRDIARQIRVIEKLKEDRVSAATKSPFEHITKDPASPDGQARLKLFYPPSNEFRLLDADSPSDMKTARETYLDENGVKILGLLPAEQVIASVVLSLFFIVIVAFKLLEPLSIKIYYDAYLHEKYKEYLNGAFDIRLPQQQQSTSATRMEAYAFHEWFYTIHERNKLSIDQTNAIVMQQQWLSIKEKSLKTSKEKLTVLDTNISTNTTKLEKIKKDKDWVSAEREKEKDKKIKAIDRLIEATEASMERMKKRVNQLDAEIIELSQGLEVERTNLKNYLKDLESVPLPGEDMALETIQDGIVPLTRMLARTITNLTDQKAALKKFEDKHEELNAERDALVASTSDTISTPAIDQKAAEVAKEALKEQSIEDNLERMLTGRTDLQKQINLIEGTIDQLTQDLVLMEMGKVSPPSAEQWKPLPIESPINKSNGKIAAAGVIESTLRES